jgi:hypothetical protein
MLKLLAASYLCSGLHKLTVITLKHDSRTKSEINIKMENYYIKHGISTKM